MLMNKKGGMDKLSPVLYLKEKNGSEVFSKSKQDRIPIYYLTYALGHDTYESRHSAASRKTGSDVVAMTSSVVYDELDKACKKTDGKPIDLIFFYKKDDQGEVSKMNSLETIEFESCRFTALYFASGEDMEQLITKINLVKNKSLFKFVVREGNNINSFLSLYTTFYFSSANEFTWHSFFRSENAGYLFCFTYKEIKHEVQLSVREHATKDEKEKKVYAFKHSAHLRNHDGDDSL